MGKQNGTTVNTLVAQTSHHTHRRQTAVFVGVQQELELVVGGGLVMKLVDSWHQPPVRGGKSHPLQPVPVRQQP